MERLENVEIDIKELYESEEGTELEFELDLDLSDALPDFIFLESAQGKLKLIRIEEGILSFLDELKTTLKLQCDYCLEDAQTKVSLRNKDRIYLSEAADIKLGELAEENLFVIDKKKMVINIAEFLREELLLNLPENVICKDKCKGLCPVCGQNRNLEDCGCSKSEEIKENPFQNLKDMLKDQ